MRLKDRILRTTRYAEFFNFPLTPDEIFHWLITPKFVPRGKILKSVKTKISQSETKYRNTLSKNSQRKLLLAKNLGQKLECLPGIRLVAVTGSVASQNAHLNDDIDLLFVTAPHLLWILRPIILSIITIYFRRRLPNENHSSAADAFCPNMWLDTTSLLISKKNRSLYTAHELLQIVPVLDKKDTYKKLIYTNKWSSHYLANAYKLTNNSNSMLKSNFLEFLFVLFLPLNYLLFLIQYLYMYPKITTEVVSLNRAYLHTTNYSKLISKHLLK